MVKQLDERYCLVAAPVKDSTLVQILMKYQEENTSGLAMIFTETCKMTQVLYLMLNDLGIEAVCLHSMITQQERFSALARFKSSMVKVLVATDVASRGLDIPMVGLVLNHTLPGIPKTYIHRVGRTARAGRKGQAVSIVTPNDLKLLLAIEALCKTKMVALEVDEDSVKKIMKQVNTTRREQEIKLDRTDFDERRNINKRKKLIMQGK